MICEATHNVISSRAWGFGRTRCDALGGLTTDQFGRVLAPANLSARQAKALNLTTSGTYGPHGFTSSRSAALRQFAESRLRARTAMVGSTLYKLIWKEWPMPSGRSFSLLRASAVRGKGTGFGGSGWPTTTASDAKSSGAMGYGGNNFMTLTDAARVSGWPTPHVGTPQSMRGTGQDPERRREQGRQVGLQDAVRWTGWPTPTTNMTTGAGEEGRSGGMNLQTAAPLAGWPTAQANDAEKRGVPSQSAGSQSCLPTAVPALASWVTPSARNWKDTPGMATERDDGKSRTDQLPRQAYMSGWPTPNCADVNNSRVPNPQAYSMKRAQGGYSNLATTAQAFAFWTTEHGPARLTVFGEMLIGFSARMESGGQLNPEHARWLMGCPSAWARSAPGWQDYAVWQELTDLALSEPRLIGSEPSAATATP